MRTLLVALSFLALSLAAAWHLGALAPLMPVLRSVTSALGGAPAGGDARPGAAAGLRKCVSGERVLYTDAACPPGYATTTVQGHVNVIAPVTPAAAPAAPPASGQAADGTLREQMIDRVVNH